VSGRDLRSVVNEVRSRVDERIEIPENYYVVYGGQFENEERASSLLFYTSLLAILVIFLLLFLEFRNMKISAVILLNLPFALIGGVISIWATSGMLSIPAIIGFITLFGIATRNGILLVSRYLSLQAEGIPLKDAIFKGSLDRLNPILMTALTAALALVPLAFSGNIPGYEIQSPMAVVILGGLFTSTLLSIFIIPAVFLLVNSKKS
jgi:Cu/Ag efflux pump CusA